MGRSVILARQRVQISVSRKRISFYALLGATCGFLQLIARADALIY